MSEKHHLMVYCLEKIHFKDKNTDMLKVNELKKISKPTVGIKELKLLEPCLVALADELHIKKKYITRGEVGN